MTKKYLSSKKLVLKIDSYFSFEKKIKKNFYLLDCEYLLKEFDANIINKINFREISQYKSNDINCIFLDIDNDSYKFSQKLNLLKLKPKLLILKLGNKNHNNKDIFSEIESFEYRMFCDLEDFIIFFYNDFEETNANDSFDLNSDLEKFKIRWGDNFLKNKNYNFLKTDPRRLLCSKRFDIAIKSHFGRLLKFNIAKDWREFVYIEHIKRITGPGEFIKEFDRTGKEGLEVFLGTFESLMKEKNFRKIPSVPLANSMIPMDGSHRISAAIVNQKKINCVKFDIKSKSNSDAEFFLGNSHLHKSCPIEIIEESAIEYCRIKNSAAIAFLFPSISDHKKALKLISENGSIIHKKEIFITPKEGKNLLRQVYLSQPWLSWTSENENFKNKVRQCFPFTGKMTVILFDDFKVSDLRSLKTRIRSFYKVGNHSIHITDSTEETLNAAKIIFNSNSVNLIRSASKFLPNFHNYLFEIKDWLSSTGINPENICIDSSAVLSAFGLRECRDIDFLYNGDKKSLISLPKKISCHNDIAYLYDYSIDEIVGDPRKHFWYLGIKFCSPELVIKMKRKRNELKDIEDVLLLSKVIPSKKILFLTKIKRIISGYKGLFFAKLKTKLKIIFLIRWFKNH